MYNIIRMLIKAIDVIVAGLNTINNRLKIKYSDLNNQKNIKKKMIDMINQEKDKNA